MFDTQGKLNRLVYKVFNKQISSKISLELDEDIKKGTTCRDYSNKFKKLRTNNRKKSQFLGEHDRIIQNEVMY